jgi:hypothetical protein
MKRRDFLKLIFISPLSFLDIKLRQDKEDILGFCFSDIDERKLLHSRFPKQRRHWEDEMHIEGMLWKAKDENCKPTRVICDDLGRVWQKGEYVVFRTFITMYGHKNTPMGMKGEIEYTKINNKTISCEYDLNNYFVGVINVKHSPV